ncbi:MAG: dTDP-4-dehydrorhamnose 3,5-epimerase [Candidatus Doudnabacteria bacterium RIFCSPLOWO2_01_FULL_44_21]|uniref:dTDP-4-dehydrorhamnose 3,5-epimerase n=1 Tax=Candidatus Doudnabacteria bacterium RIFCSPLOWO2_01_FULL_44_21 TaxID=1817841 RepID=A0A1F5PXI2_9BACT|nr:MAG: dTDP-4-dehydrorhamnose 3,5-epimerase [Candidatus Doudnabacteria bacterium RIFCSPHIGHO2_02_FULL_43_13b]OGE94651.1 MAG: dTDP-4-dehydrorhamnose 3,5-epimerase [Candidatus Doudnabacteria bacterium RIFCSPLOWO2_01_FULL_44_21]
MSQITEFKIKQTEIPGLLEIDISLMEDERGYFQEKFQKEKLVAAGFPESFTPVQQSVSYNKEVGVTRGFHAEPWEKYIAVITGKAFGAYLDLRPGQNFGKIVTIELNPTKAVFLPRGVANAFQTLTPDVYYSYLINAHWSSQAKYQSVNLKDPEIHIDWPINLAEAIISEKDLNNPFLKDFR